MTDPTQPAPAEALNNSSAVYNFDHGLRAPHALQFGPFRIYVKAEHIDPGILARNEVHHFTSQLDEDGAIRPHVETRPPVEGRWAPTAEVEADDSLQGQSTLLPDVPGRTAKDDLALVLSFVCGRRVAIGNDAAQKSWLKSGERLVSDLYFLKPRFDWGVLQSIANTGGADAMELVCNAMESSELMVRIALGSAALDCLSGQWFGAHGTSRYSKEVKEKFSSVKPVFEAALRANGMDDSLIKDIVPRLPNLCSESAIAKLQAFLAANDMFSSSPAADATSRLSLLNKHRNAVLHRATIHLTNQLSFEMNLQVAANVANVILLICRVYIAKHLLKIEDPGGGIELDRKSIVEFFETGVFRRHAVFEEPFEEYLERLEEAWTGGAERTQP